MGCEKPFLSGLPVASFGMMPHHNSVPFQNFTDLIGAKSIAKTSI